MSAQTQAIKADTQADIGLDAGRRGRAVERLCVATRVVRAHADVDPTRAGAIATFDVGHRRSDAPPTHAKPVANRAKNAAIAIHPRAAAHAANPAYAAAPASSTTHIASNRAR